MRRGTTGTSARLLVMTLTTLVLSACGDGISAPGATTPERSAQTQPTSIAWFNGTLDAAFELARSEKKPVFVYWGADWCPYCESLKSTVFNRPDFIEQSRQVVPVYLNGDLPEAQKWGAEFKVVGYPTILVFRSDRTEITRVAGGMDLTQYASVLERALKDERPIGEVLTATARSSAALAADCRRLAYHAWDLKAEDEESNAKKAQQQLASELTRAAAACQESDVNAQTRLSMHALLLALSSESEAIEEGRAPTTALTERVRALSLLLTNAEGVAAALNILVSLDSALYKVVQKQGPSFTDTFLTNWTAAMTHAARNAHYGEGERLLAMATALDGLKELRKDQPLPPELVSEARRQVNDALEAEREASARTDIVNGARIVYSVLEDDQATYDLLSAEIPRSKTPYYYMPTLAAIAERRGDKAEALWWYERAYASTSTPGAKAKWGSSYLRALTRLTPDDVPEIEKIALEVADALNARDAELEKSPQRASRLTDSLKKWANTPTRKAVVAQVSERLTSPRPHTEESRVGEVRRERGGETRRDAKTQSAPIS